MFWPIWSGSDSLGIAVGFQRCAMGRCKPYRNASRRRGQLARRMRWQARMNDSGVRCFAPAPLGAAVLFATGACAFAIHRSNVGRKRRCAFANRQMSYDGAPVACRNYPGFSDMASGGRTSRSAFRKDFPAKLNEIDEKLPVPRTNEQARRHQ